MQEFTATRGFTAMQELLENGCGVFIHFLCIQQSQAALYKAVESKQQCFRVLCATQKQRTGEKIPQP